MIDTGTDPLRVQNGCQQTRHRRFTGSACHTHELHLLHRGGDVYKRQLLKNADPEVKAQLRLALLT